MSRLNVANFRHPDATADSVVITSGGDTQIQRALGLGGATYGTSGQVLTSAGSGAAPTWEDATNLTRATAIASTSGTSIDFESLPSGIRRITIMLANVSTNGTSEMIVQLGDSGGYETSGYSSRTADLGTTQESSSDGFKLSTDMGATHVYHGAFYIDNIDGNTWVCTGQMSRSDGGNIYRTGGSKALSAECDRIRLTTQGGSNTFDAGTVNIMYEV